ncbi:MAG: hypothetical protein Q9227_001326 [Pyrenula ochraceoflavens]
MGQDVPHTLDLEEYQHSPLSLQALPWDVINSVCNYVDDAPHDDRGLNPIGNLAKVNKYLRDVSVPQLFKTVSVRGDWNYAFQRLEEMRYCPALTTYTKTFKFDLFVDSDEPPPHKLPSALAETLGRLSNLEKFVLRIPDQHSEVFEVAMKDVRLPNVHTLVVGPFCEYAISLCPNTTTLSTNGWAWRHSDRGGWQQNQTMRLIRAAAAAEKLTDFNIDGTFEECHLEAILENTPQITHLGTVGGDFDSSIHSYLPALSKFENLTHLYLSDASQMGVGWDGGPWCGNAYMGPGGDELLRQVQADGREAEAKVANLVFPEIPGLKELWIGDGTKVQVVRDQDGGMKDVVFDRSESRDKVPRKVAEDPSRSLDARDDPIGTPTVTASVKGATPCSQDNANAIVAELKNAGTMLRKGIGRLSPVTDGGDIYWNWYFGSAAAKDGSPDALYGMYQDLDEKLSPITDTSDGAHFYCLNTDALCGAVGSNDVFYKPQEQMFYFCKAWFDDKKYLPGGEVVKECQGEKAKIYSMRDFRNSKPQTIVGAMLTGPFMDDGRNGLVAPSFPDTLRGYTLTAPSGKSVILDLQAQGQGYQSDLDLAAGNYKQPTGDDLCIYKHGRKSGDKYPSQCSLWNRYSHLNYIAGRTRPEHIYPPFIIPINSVHSRLFDGQLRSQRQ